MNTRKFFLCVGFILLAAPLFYAVRQASQIPSAARIEAALQTTIPKLELRDASTSHAVSVVLDSLKQQNPDLESLDFEFCYIGPYDFNPWKSPGQITLTLSNVSAELALEYISAFSMLHYTCRRGKIYFYPIGLDGGVPALTPVERLQLRVQMIYSRFVFDLKRLF